MKQALHFPDITVPEISKGLYVGSDVFALCQENFNVWVGARNGTVHVFDTRNSQKMEVLHNRFSFGERHTSITHIRRIREFELLVTGLNGRVSNFFFLFSPSKTLNFLYKQAELYDTRFIRRTRCPDPILTLEGDIDSNRILHNLVITISHARSGVVADQFFYRISGLGY